MSLLSLNYIIIKRQGDVSLPSLYAHIACQGGA